MLKTRGRKILRDILGPVKGRTALVSISIMIGVFGAVALISDQRSVDSPDQSRHRPDEVAMTRLYVTIASAGAK